MMDSRKANLFKFWQNDIKFTLFTKLSRQHKKAMNFNRGVLIILCNIKLFYALKLILDYY